MIYVLDTDTCIYFLNAAYPSIAEEISGRTLEELAITSVSVAELYYGAHHSSRRESNIERLQKFLQLLQILAFDAVAAEEFGEMKEALMREGRMLGPYDLLIASIVRAKKFTLVTHNQKEFSSVKNLLMVDWVR